MPENSGRFLSGCEIVDKKQDIVKTPDRVNSRLPEDTLEQGKIQWNEIPKKMEETLNTSPLNLKHVPNTFQHCVWSKIRKMLYLTYFRRFDFCKFYYLVRWGMTKLLKVDDDIALLMREEIFKISWLLNDIWMMFDIVKDYFSTSLVLYLLICLSRQH